MMGQLEAVERALDSGSECDAILQQLAAIRGAANALMSQVLEGHVREHLRAKPGTDLDVLVGILQRYLR